MSFQQFIKKLSSPPNKLFLMDGLGAVLSAFLLGVVLVQLEEYIGMPPSILYGLALVACCFAVYSISCYFKIGKNWQPFLKAIAFANLTYCFVTIGLVFYCYAQLSTLGLLYFLLEHLVVFSIIAIELKVAYRS